MFKAFQRLAISTPLISTKTLLLRPRVQLQPALLHTVRTPGATRLLPLAKATVLQQVRQISIRKRRKLKMNKHKLKKLRKSVRHSSRYNKDRRRKKGEIRRIQD